MLEYPSDCARLGESNRAAACLNMPPVQVKLLDNFAGPLPPLQPALPGDAGVDLYAAENVTIPPGGRKLILTGMAIAIPDHYEAQVRPKSGLSLKGAMTVLGTVDAGYRGEIKVLVQNIRPHIDAGILDALVNMCRGTMDPDALGRYLNDAREDLSIEFKRGEKIGQLVFARFERPEIYVLGDVEDLPDSVRGTGGFGSTGR